MTLDPVDSIAALERMSELLRDGGQLLQVIKIPKNRSKSSILRKIEGFGYIIEDVIEPEKQETYIIARKMLAGEDYENEELFVDEDGIEYDLRVESGADGIDITDMHFEGEEE